MFFNSAQSRAGELERDKSFFFGEPESFCLKIWQKTAARLPSDLQPNSLLFFRNTARYVRKAPRRPFSCNLTDLRHTDPLSKTIKKNRTAQPSSTLLDRPLKSLSGTSEYLAIIVSATRVTAFLSFIKSEVAVDFVPIHTQVIDYTYAA